MKKKNKNDDLVEMDIRTICAFYHLTVEELADKCDISVNHLRYLMKQRSRMFARDVKHLHDGIGIPYENIKME